VTVYRKALFRDRDRTIKRTLFTLERRPDGPPRCLPGTQAARIHAQRLELSRFGSLEPDNSDTFVSSPPVGGYDLVSIEKCSLLQFLLAERGRSAAHLYQSRNIAEHLKTDLKPGPTISVLTLKRAFVGISDGATNCAGASGPRRNFGRSNNRSNRSRCVLRWMWLILNRLLSHAETGTGEAQGAGRHRAQ